VTAAEKFVAFVSVLAFMVIMFRLNVRLFNATKRFSWLPMHRSYVSRALFDRQLADTFVAEIIGLVVIVATIVSILPPLPAGAR
jgi:Fe2+ transport system protein B